MQLDIRMRQNSYRRLSEAELIKLAPKYGFRINREEDRIALKTYYSIKNVSDFGVVLIGALSLFPLYLAITQDELFVKVVLGFLGIPMLTLSILTVIKQNTDFLIVNPTDIQYKNSLKTFHLKTDRILGLKLRHETIQRKNARSRPYLILEVIVTVSEGDKRIFDFSGDAIFRDELSQLGYFILKEIRKKTTADIL
jgi:hypothetical protein